MKATQLLSFLLQLLRYWLVKIVMVIVRFLVKLHIFPTFNKHLIAAYAVSSGADAYNNKQYLKSFSILKPVADYDFESPYVGSCQYMLGVLYQHGLGIDKDIEKAKSYLMKAASQGNEDAVKYLKRTQEKTG